MGLKMKNFNIMGVHKILEEEVTKIIYRGIPKKWGLDSLQGA